jgi:hypothetical protein
MTRSILVVCSLVGSVAPASAALLGRDLDGAPGYDAYYDTTLGITWLADANLAKSNNFGVSGIEAGSGLMNWSTAQSWILAMNGANYLGVSAWRLPSMVDIDGDGCLDNFAMDGTDCGYNAVSVGPDAGELASLFYDTLGNLAFYDTSGTPQLPGLGIQNTGPFSNLSNTLYWYGLETTSNPSGRPNPLATPSNAWYFGMPSGGQRPIAKVTVNPMTAWAVVDGDIAAVPLPAAGYLFGTAVGAMLIIRRKLR